MGVNLFQIDFYNINSNSLYVTPLLVTLKTITTWRRIWCESFERISMWRVGDSFHPPLITSPSQLGNSKKSISPTAKSASYFRCINSYYCFLEVVERRQINHLFFSYKNILSFVTLSEIIVWYHQDQCDICSTLELR